tara:strand:+ start:1904 stop:2158 length:255 start_codon:yes stop_codon:yes gene_type:complete
MILLRENSISFPVEFIFKDCTQYFSRATCAVIAVIFTVSSATAFDIETFVNAVDKTADEVTELFHRLFFGYSISIDFSLRKENR